MMERSDIVNKLRSNQCVVKFTKVNGESRVMHCTLRPIDLPEQTDLEESVYKKSQDVVAVWDLDKGAWRSFRVDSVVELNVV